MTCTRCQGLMVDDYLLDIQNPSGELWIRAWRCLNCGEIVESTISLNRASRFDRARGSATDRSPGGRLHVARRDAA